MIWRVKDSEALHKLKIKNVSPVVSLSMHPSGRMLLALYANGMLRLWNMLDARCHYKRKVGLSGESDNEDEEVKKGEKTDEEKADEVMKKFMLMN